MAAAFALSRAGGGEVAVVHVIAPNGTLPPGLPSDAAPVTPFALSAPPPAAAEVAGLRLTPAGGGARSLAELRGERATVVAFVASYCAPCRDELSQLAARVPALRRQGVALLVADLEEPADVAASFVRQQAPSLLAYVDADGSAHDGLGLVGVPSSAVLAADGSVSSRLEGYTGPEALDEALAAVGIRAQ